MLSSFLTVTICFMPTIIGVFADLDQDNLVPKSRVSLSKSSDDSGGAPNNTAGKICFTPGCIEAAATVLSNIDESVDPCDNFYQFSCGGWLKRHRIPEYQSSFTVFTAIEDELNTKLGDLLLKPLSGSAPHSLKTLKAMFDSCLDVKSIEEEDDKHLQNVLKSLGGWPVVEGPKWNDSTYDWMDTLIRFRKIGFSHDILLDLSIMVDLQNNTRHVINIDQTSLGMPDRIYFMAGLSDLSTAAYYKLMTDSATMLGADKKTAQEEMMKSLQFETNLAKLCLPREDRRNLTLLYNNFTVKGLQDFIPQINWMKYFRGLLQQEVTEDDVVIVNVPEFLANFTQLITNTDKRTVANYMIWRIVKQSLFLLSSRWRKIFQDYNFVISGNNLQGPRWRQCLISVTGSLSLALSSYYVRENFNENSKRNTMDMVNYIIKEFINILVGLEWMDEITKKQAIEKAESIATYIGYPSELLDDIKISKLYENLKLDNNSYFNNTCMLKKWTSDFVFGKFRQPHDKKHWINHGRVAVVNAYYSYTENSIQFPAGILQHTLFNKKRPQYMNFGSIGVVIGHEITHGFDDKGRQYDKEGNNRNWWDEYTSHYFREKAQCMIDQYSNYTMIENGLKVNGINTQGENIADNGGLKAAYKAYKSWENINGVEPLLPGLKYSPRQLFWICSANIWCGKYKPEAIKLNIASGVHSLGHVRVTGVVSNLKEFSEDFHCPLGSPMNPYKKCEVW